MLALRQQQPARRVDGCGDGAPRPGRLVQVEEGHAPRLLAGDARLAVGVDQRHRLLEALHRVAALLLCVQLEGKARSRRQRALGWPVAEQ